MMGDFTYNESPKALPGFPTHFSKPPIPLDPKQQMLTALEDAATKKPHISVFDTAATLLNYSLGYSKKERWVRSGLGLVRRLKR